MISVVIATYGDQAWSDLAWSRAYPSALAEEPTQIVIHHSMEQTIGPARNDAALQAEGEWLLFLDADDELQPGYLDAMIQAICKPGRPEPALLQPAVIYQRKHVKALPVLLAEKDLRHDNFLVIGTVLRRSLFREVGGFEDFPHGFEDWSLWAKCWKAGAKIVPVEDAVYIAHINPRSAHRQMWSNRRLQVQTHLDVQARLFPEGVT